MISCDAERRVGDGVKRFEEEQMFEEDVRAVMAMFRPNRRERLAGWNEYRSGGAHFRATVSWAPEFGATAADVDDPAQAKFAVPRLADVLEAILIGSVRSELDLPLADEFDLYRGVVRELYKRVNETQSCYE